MKGHRKTERLRINVDYVTAVSGISDRYKAPVSFQITKYIQNNQLKHQIKQEISVPTLNYCK